MAKAGKVPARKIIVSLVKRIHRLTGGNVAETVRRTGLHRRTVLQKLGRDPEK